MENEKKKNISVYFYFLVVVTNEKKKIMKKKICCRINWATAQLYCEKKKKLYCKAEIVLQEEVGLARSCIAIQQIVLQPWVCSG